MFRSGISELLEIVFHYILYAKKVYPEKLFEKRIRYYLPIWKCNNFAVSSYISNFLMFLEKFLGHETSVDVALIIMKDSEVLEEFVFEVQYPNVQENSKDIPKFKIEDLLTSISHALNSVSSAKTPSNGNTFELQIRSDCSIISLSDIEDHLKKENFPWTAVEDPDIEPWTKMIPQQAIDNPRFKIQICHFQKDC